LQLQASSSTDLLHQNETASHGPDKAHGFVILTLRRIFEDIVNKHTDKVLVLALQKWLSEQPSSSSYGTHQSSSSSSSSASNNIKRIKLQLKPSLSYNNNNNANNYTNNNSYLLLPPATTASSSSTTSSSSSSSTVNFDFFNNNNNNSNSNNSYSNQTFSQYNNNNAAVDSSTNMNIELSQSSTHYNSSAYDDDLSNYTHLRNVNKNIA
jgi:hypothetical protein